MVEEPGRIVEEEGVSKLTSDVSHPVWGTSYTLQVTPVIVPQLIKNILRGSLYDSIHFKAE